MNELIENLMGEQKDPALAAERSEARAKVGTTVRALPPMQRGLIELVFFDGVALLDAARLMGLTRGTALSILLRAQSVLFGALKDFA